MGLPLHLVPADVAAHVRSHAVQFLRPADPKVETWRLQKEQTPVNTQSVHPGVESSRKAPARPIKKGDIVRYNKQSVHSHSRRGWRGTVQRVDGDMLYVDWRATDGGLRYRDQPTSEDDITRVT